MTTIYVDSDFLRSLLTEAILDKLDHLRDEIGYDNPVEEIAALESLNVKVRQPDEASGTITSTDHGYKWVPANLETPLPPTTDEQDRLNERDERDWDQPFGQCR